MKVRLLVLLSLLVAPIWGQVFPGGVATDADLLVARDKASSTLDGDIDGSVNTFNVTVASTFTDNMVVVIDDEQIFCTTFSGTTFSGCTRGYGGTSAAPHDSGAGVYGYIVAAHHNGLKDELKAIENSLVGSSYIGAMLRFGGTSSSYPALKAGGNILQARLADDSGFASFDAGSIASKSGSGTHHIWNNSGADTDEKIWTATTDTSGNWMLRAEKDDWSSWSDALMIARSGITPGPATWNVARIVQSSSALSRVFYESDAATDEKYWRFFINGGTFSVQTTNDSYASPVDALSFERSGTTIGDITFNSNGATRLKYCSSSDLWAFGDCTSSYPALKRHDTALDVRKGDGTYGALWLNNLAFESTYPWITFHDTNADTDEKYWNLIADQGAFTLKLLDDSYANPKAILYFGRSGTTPGTGIFYGDRFEHQSALPSIDINETDAGTDEKRWRIYVNGGKFYIQTLKDGYGTAANALIIDRSGNSATNFVVTTAPSNGNAMAVNSSGLKIYDMGTKPTCNATTRGYIWREEGGAGVADKLEVCAKNSSDTYAWYPLASIP